MRVIGITGGVGAGKSTVLHMLEELCNCKIIVADDVAKKIMSYDGPLTMKALELFGEEAYGPDGELGRNHISKMIYADDALREKWSNAVHPEVNKEIYGQIDAARAEGKYDFVFVEAALLIENGYDRICDELWYVYAPEDIRSARLMESRGYSQDKIESIFRSQMKDEEFRKHCRFVIDTGVSVECTYNALKNKLEEYSRM